MYKRGLAPIIANVIIILLVLIAVGLLYTTIRSFIDSTTENIEEKSETYLGNNDPSNTTTQDTTPDTGVEELLVETLTLNSDTSKIINTLVILDNSTNNIMCEFEDNTETDFRGDTRFLMNFNNGEIIDYSGYKNYNQTFNITDCNQEGIFSNSCYFDGIDDHIDVNLNNASFDWSTPYTISFWINDSYPDSASSYVAIGDGYNSDNWDKDFGIAYNPPKFYFRLWTGSSDYFYAFDTNYTGNQWNHLVGIYNGSHAIFYVNGEIGNSTLARNAGQVGLTNIIFSLNNTYRRGFEGFLDEVNIYSKSLTNEEVQLLYNSRKALLYEQILPEGQKEIDVSDCNLIPGRAYRIITSNSEESTDQVVIATT